jgi:hypothetical protein
LGQAKHSPSQKNQAQKKEKPARGKDWREMDAGMKTIFPKSLDTASNR